MNDKTLATPSPRRRLSSGRPARYGFFGLFLPSVEWELKTECIPWHEMENEPNELGTLFRNMRRQDVNPSESFLSVLPIIREKLPPLIAAHFDTAARAIENGTFTDDLLENLPGHWATFCLGAVNSKSPYFHEYEVVESACKDADGALHKGDYRLAADLVQNSATLRQYWSDAALHGLANAKTDHGSLIPRSQAWLQLQVSVLAKWSMRDQNALQAQLCFGTLEDLLTEVRRDGSAAPGAMWLRAMVRLTKAPSLSKMIELVHNETASSDLPSEATIKRWSSGSLFPVPTPKLEKFVERVSSRAVLADLNLDRAQIFESATWYLWAARRFNSLLWFASLPHGSPSDPKTATHSLAPSTRLRAEFRRWQAFHKRPPVLSLD